MSARSNTARKRRRGNKLVVVEKEVKAIVPNTKLIVPLSEEEFYSPGMKKLLWVGILLIWIWMFSYAPEYIGIHTSWMIWLCHALCFVFLGIILMIAHFSLQSYLDKADIGSITILSIIMFTIMAPVCYYAGNTVGADPIGIAKYMRVMCFISSLCSIMGIVYYFFPLLIYTCIYKLKSSKDVFTAKNIFAFALAILTILTAVFQFLQVVLPLLTTKH